MCSRDKNSGKWVVTLQETTSSIEGGATHAVAGEFNGVSPDDFVHEQMHHS